VVTGEKVTMSLAFIIELHSEAVGLVVRDGRRYRFHSAVEEFSRLDGRSFRSPRDAEKAIRQQDSRAKGSPAVVQNSHFGQASGALAACRTSFDE